jgi:hypothetical protein
MTAFHHYRMQSVLTFFGLETLSFWELLAIFGGCVLVALVVVACLPGRRRPVNSRLFSHLIHRVQHRREQLFNLRPPRAVRGAARERYLESVRERVRACDIFHPESTE